MRHPRSASEARNISYLILRSRAQHGVSKDGRTARTRGHPSRRAQERAPQDEVDDFSQALPQGMTLQSLWSQ